MGGAGGRLRSAILQGLWSTAKPFRMALGALIIKARLGLTDEELIKQIKENPYLQFFIGLEDFQTSVPFDPSMMVYFRKRLPEAVVNDCNERIVRNGLNLIQASETEDQDQDDSQGGGGNVCDIEQNINSKTTLDSQGSLLIDATCAPVNNRYPTDHSLLNKAREVTEILIDSMVKKFENHLITSHADIAIKLDSIFLLFPKRNDQESTKFTR